VFTKTSNVPRLAALLLSFVELPWTVLAARVSSQSQNRNSQGAFRWDSLTRFSVDLNGDARPEKVALSSYGSSRTIEIQQRNSRSRSVIFTAAGPRPGFLIPYDIDHDADLDLIWSNGPDHKTFVVCLNDGAANFRIAADSASYDAEISGLLDNDNSPGPRPFKVQRSDQRLNASSSCEIELGPAARASAATVQSTLRSSEQTFALQSDFFTYLLKRGPPTTLL